MDRDDVVRHGAALAGSAAAGFLLARTMDRSLASVPLPAGAHGPWPRLRRALLHRPAVRLASLLNPEARLGGAMGQKLQGMEVHEVPGAGASGTAKAYLFRPTGLTAADPLPALLWLHAGESLLAHPYQDHALCRRLAEEAGVVVVAPTCRACPRRSFPEAVEDACTVLSWMEARAQALGLEQGRFGVGGVSGGAGLAAAVVQAAQDRGGPRILFQVLRSPVLGADSPGARLQEQYGYALQRQDLFGLPPAWAGWGQWERCRDDAELYVRRLEDAGTRVDTAELLPGCSSEAAGQELTGDMIRSVRNALHRY